MRSETGSPNPTTRKLLSLFMLQRRYCIYLIIFTASLLAVYIIYNFTNQPNFLVQVHDPCRHSEEYYGYPDVLTHNMHVESNTREVASFIEENNLIALLDNFPVNKPKAVIHSLIEESPIRVDRLQLMLTKLDGNFNDMYKYPVVLFYTRPINNTIKSALKNSTSSSLYFLQANFSMPDFVQKPIPKWTCIEQQSLRHRHRTRFLTRLLYEYNFMKHTDYLWRIGEHSLLLDKLYYDIFHFMASKNYLYGFIRINNDQCMCGLQEAAKKYIDDQFIKPEHFSKWLVGDVYYSNFEISHRGVWTSPEYRDYVNYMDKTGGIYLCGWSDAAVKTIAMTIFLRESKMYQFTDLTLTHDGLGIPAATYLGQSRPHS